MEMLFFDVSPNNRVVMCSFTFSRSTIILLYVVFATVTWKCITIPCSDFGDGWTLSFLLGTFKQVGAFVLFGLIPLGLVKFGFRENLADYGFRLGDRRKTLRSFLFMAPVIVGVAIVTGFNPNFFDVYPFNPALRPHNAHVSPSIFAVNAVLYLGYYFGWEFLFRGFLQHGLRESCGLANAVLIQTLASTMLHFGHPSVEVFASIVAGIFWGWLAVQTRSLLSGFLQHALLGIILDAALMYGR